MSQIEIERFLGRILTDEEFREKAKSSLKSACYSEGIDLSTVEVSLLQHINFSLFGMVAETLDDSIRRGLSGTWVQPIISEEAGPG
jgi:hypothetical protein